MKPDDPAFPLSGFMFEGQGPREWIPSQKGMSLRAYFAGKAMQAHVPMPWPAGWSGHYEQWREYVASESVLMADALIAELNKEKT